MRPMHVHQRQVSRRVPPVTPEMIDEAVTSDGAQPGHRIGAPIEAIPVADGLDERLLRQLLGEGCIAGAADGKVAIHARHHAVVPVPERLGIGDDAVEPLDLTGLLGRQSDHPLWGSVLGHPR